MLRSTRKILQVTVVSSGIESVTPKNAQCVQFVRGVRPRKPMYSGPAKSKLFKILPRHRENVPEPELAEVRRLERNYNFLLKNISNFCREENARDEAGSKVAVEEIAAEEAAWQQSLQKIKEWNLSVAAMREKRLANERVEKELKVAKAIEQQEELQRQRVEEAKNILLREKELSKSFITEENIDAAIERALDDSQDFNYSIDFKGKIYKGRFTKPNDREDSGKIPIQRSHSSASPLSSSSSKEAHL